MTLNYDFDIFDIAPSDKSNDPELQGFLSKAGLSKAPQDSAVALFRDQRTVDALCQAPVMLREFFLQSGFGLNTYDSGAPVGYYPAQDEEARLGVIDQLTQNASRFLLIGDPEDGDQFRLADFITQLGAAKPTDTQFNDVCADAIGPVTPRDSVGKVVGEGIGFASITKRVLRRMPLLRPFRSEQRAV